MKHKIQDLLDRIQEMDTDEKIIAINEIKIKLHEISPFKNEPVDCVVWEKIDNIQANDYNPNKVAPPEMELLGISILEDGYTQPIVTWPSDGKIEVIDGFHRNRVGKENKQVNKRILGYLPIVKINSEREGKNDRIASTIRHNRARGKHQIDSMSEIVLELKNRNWKNERIARELGMDMDEILRLCQITGLAGLFEDEEFSKSWDIENSEPDFIPIDDDDEFEESETCKVVNTDDEKRIFHTWDKWECHEAGFYTTTKEGMKADECEQAYADFLGDTDKFKKALQKVITEWKNSCEHYLTNFSMNRIAWLGQASMCCATGVPAKYASGFYILTDEQQEEANQTALIYLNKWLVANGHEQATIEQAMPTRQSTIY